MRNDPEESHRQHIFTLSAVATRTAYSTRYASSEEIPKFRLPQIGASADAVYRILKDELDLDGVPNLNLARYVGWYMRDELVSPRTARSESPGFLSIGAGSKLYCALLIVMVLKQLRWHIHGT